ncbi:unnamed protein product [Blepharisma stoltei]|uniref:PLAC8 family protein n=1 Tax=Blepharisma stoltei TaxID=1481888 RepID=A0AAU9JU38_9CILI|nr:unnamed protein product [Blepharisma stoltei]
MSEFETGLYECCKSFNKICFLSCCPCGPACIQAKAVSITQNNEHFYEAFAYSIFLCCIGSGLNRQHIREFYDIDGSLLGDICCHLACDPCSSAQEYNEVIKKSKPRRPTLKSAVNFYTSMAKI